MATLKETLSTQLTAALKEGDKLRTSVLRGVLGAISTAEKSGKTARVFNDEQVLEVVFAQAKQRQQSIEDYLKAGATDRAAVENAELDILTTYLPEPLTEDEVASIAADVIAENEGAGFGQIMKTVTARTKFRADGKTVSAVVKAKLA